MGDRWVRHLLCGVACATLTCTAVHGLESDQFTLPPQQLTDFGGEVSWIVWEHLQPIVEQANAAIKDNKYKAEISTTKPGKRYRLREIDRMSDGKYLAHQLYLAIGRGFPEVRIEKLIQGAAETYPERPAIYETGFGESIYSGSAFSRPLNVVGIVPTVKTYGVYTGTDKFGHMLQQGYEYYEDFIDEEEDGASKRECFYEAVDGGIGQEDGIYGRIPSGTYSNADLASNYAGLKFYLNLTRPVRIGNRIEPPLLVFLDNHGWVWNESTWERWGSGLLKPFISAHFSEADNPAQFDWTMRGGIRDSVTERGAAWVTFHHTSRAREQRRLRAMESWFGEPYGHSGWEDVITIVNAYFDTLDEPAVVAETPAATASSLAQRERHDDGDARRGVDGSLNRGAVKRRAE